jgi:hypothetical protein
MYALPTPAPAAAAAAAAHLTVQGSDPVRRLNDRSRVLRADRKNRPWGTLPRMRLWEASNDCMYVMSATESFNVPLRLRGNKQQQITADEHRMLMMQFANVVKSRNH